MYHYVRVLKLVYVAYVRTLTIIGVRMILAMRTLTRTLIFPYDFLKFSKLYTFYKLTAMYLTLNLFVCPWKTQILECLHLF